LAAEVCQVRNFPGRRERVCGPHDGTQEGTPASPSHYRRLRAVRRDRHKADGPRSALPNLCQAGNGPSRSQQVRPTGAL